MKSIRSIWLKLTIRARWRIIYVFMLMSFFYVYKSGIEQLIFLKRETVRLRKMAASTPSTNSEASYNVIKTATAAETLEYISSYCNDNDIYIREITQYQVPDSAQYLLESSKLTLVGKYAETLKLLFDIERTRKMTIVNSAYWALTKDAATGKYELSATFFIKNLKYEKDNYSAVNAADPGRLQ